MIAHTQRDTDRGALLGVGGDPVAGLAVVVTLLDPLLDEVTSAERIQVILQSMMLSVIITM